MRVERLGYQNFRNLIDGEIIPYEGINVIYGANAQGKTNLIEGIWLFTGGHSFRGVKDSELPKLDEKSMTNSPSAALFLDFYSRERTQKAVLKINNGRRSSVINGVEKSTGSALIGKVCGVVFSPEHLLLVKEGPAKRRSFIDGALCQIKPFYAKLLAVYNRSLLQRNALLKDIGRLPKLSDTLEIWDAKIAEIGAQVIYERYSYIEKLRPKIEIIYGGISKNNEKIGVKYCPSIKDIDSSFEIEDIRNRFFESLRRSEKSDIRAGFTSIGPHRDDIEITVDLISARTFGSQGQQRSAVLSMKLVEAEILAENTGESPIILLDDVMSELDSSRQDYLLNHLHDKQVFITCCTPETVNLMETGKKFRIESGRVFQE